jgi:hypothetical protein
MTCTPRSAGSHLLVTYRVFIILDKGAAFLGLQLADAVVVALTGISGLRGVGVRL